MLCLVVRTEMVNNGEFSFRNFDENSINKTQYIIADVNKTRIRVWGD